MGRAPEGALNPGRRASRQDHELRRSLSAPCGKSCAGRSPFAKANHVKAGDGCVSDEPERGDRVRRRYEHGFAQVPRLLLLRDPAPAANAVHVFALLDLHADRQTGACYPAQRTLATEMGVSKSTVRRALDDLEAYGFVIATPRMHPRYGRIGTDYELTDTPCSPVSTGGAMGEHGGCSPVTTNQEPEHKEKHDNNKVVDPESPGPVVVSAAAPPEPGAEQVLVLMMTLAADVPATAAKQWLRENGTQTVVEHLDWLRAEINSGRAIESRGGWLRDSFGWSEPPASYRRLLQEREREARRRVEQEAAAARDEQAATERQHDQRRRAELREKFEAMAPDQRVQVDRRARDLVPHKLGEVPPLPMAWEAVGLAPALWRQAIGEMIIGAPAAD